MGSRYSSFSKSVVLAIVTSVTSSTVYLSGNEALEPRPSFFAREVSEVSLSNDQGDQTQSQNSTKEPSSSDFNEHGFKKELIVKGGELHTSSKSFSSQSKDFQHYSDINTEYTIEGVLSWEEVSALEPQELSEQELSEEAGVETIPEATTLEISLPETLEETVLAETQPHDDKKGLAFCFVKKTEENVELEVREEQQQRSLLEGIILTGSKTKPSGITFKSIKADESGAAVYSDKDVLFDFLPQGLMFDGCESKQGGGAVCAENISIKGCNGITVRNCKSEVVELQREAQVDDLAYGGGAFLAREATSSQSKAKERAEGLLEERKVGTIFISENSGDIEFSKNTSTYNGGAIAAKKVVFEKQGLGKMSFLENRAQSGGAISSSEEVSFLKNEGSIFFGENYAERGAVVKQALKDKQAKIPLSGVEEIGGGAIATNGVARFSGNFSGIEFSGNRAGVAREGISTQEEVVVNTSIHGGAVYCQSFELKDNLGDVLFSDNAATGSGGAIYCKGSSADHIMLLGAEKPSSVDISGNKGRVVFIDNGNEGLGGAIFSSGDVRIADNQTILFSRNRAKTDFVSEEEGAEKTRNSEGKDVPFNGLGGAIFGKAISIQGNREIAFSDNGALYMGGALCCSGELKLSDNTGAVRFLGNYVFQSPEEEMTSVSIAAGGAVSAPQKVSISGNTGKVEFLRNSAGKHGGAIVIGTPKLDSSKGSYIVDNGVSSSEVKAISESVVATMEIINNPGAVTFFGNEVVHQLQKANEKAREELSEVACLEYAKKYGGGAIHTNRLMVANSGEVLFKDNSAPRGGAVLISEKGSVNLSADLGDIIFKGNKRTSANEGESSSDCITFLGKESRIDRLRAQSGRKILFADAIRFEEDAFRSTTSGKTKDVQTEGYTLIINGKDPSPKEGEESTSTPVLDYSGSVEFAGGCTKIPQNVQLQGGALVVSGGELWVAGFKQEAGASIHLAAGSTFGQYIPEGGDNEGAALYSLVRDADASSQPRPAKAPFDLETIYVDIGSFGSNSNGPQLVLLPEGNTTTTFSQPDSGKGLKIELVDSSGQGMSNPALLSSSKDFAFIQIMQPSGSGDAGTLKPIESADAIGPVTFSLGTGMNASSGYQGSWSGSQLVNGRLVVQWQPSGYKPDAIIDGTIVSNTLWSQYTDVKAIKREIFNNHTTEQRLDLEYATNVWVSGLGHVVHSDTVREDDGFIHRSGGYTLGMDSEILEDFMIGGSFSQSFGYTDSRLHPLRSRQKGYIGSLYAELNHFDKEDGTWIFKGAFLYGNLNNEMQTINSNTTTLCQWCDHAYMASLRLDRRKYKNVTKRSSSMINVVVPFIEIEYTHANLSKFLEKLRVGTSADKLRFFEKGKMDNFALPLGVGFENHYYKGEHSEIHALSFAYSPDIFRNLPRSTITLASAPSSGWYALGNHWSRHAVRCRYDNNIEWNANFGTYFGLEFEGRRHVLSFQGSGGARLIF